MGCDIHLYAEKRSPSGAWVEADDWQPNPYHADDPENEPPLHVPYGAHFYEGRNYNLFGMLANVRNGRGFAGCDLGAGFWPISPPRGLPADVTPRVKAASDRWGVDGHSHSWLTVAELLAYDWTQTTVSRGWVNLPEFWEWNRWGRKHGAAPASYCGGVSGDSVRHVSLEEMEQLATDFDPRDTQQLEAGQNIYCQVEWEHPYYRAATDFLSATMPRLWRLGAPDNVRIVFWFDN